MTWGVPLLVSYHFAFSYCSWGSQGKNTEVACHSLLQGTTFCQTSPPWPTHLGLSPQAWLGFIELDKAVVLVWLDWLVFFDYGFSLSALWCALIPYSNTYHLTWVSLTLDMGYLFMAAPAQHSRCSSPWMRGISSRLPLLTSNIRNIVFHFGACVLYLFLSYYLCHFFSFNGFIVFTFSYFSYIN